MTLQRKSAGSKENWLKNSQRDNNSFSLNALLTKYQGDCRFQIQLYSEIMFWVSKQKYKIKMASKLPFNRITNQNGCKKSRFVFIFGIELSSRYGCGERELKSPNKIGLHECLMDDIMFSVR